MSTFLRTTAVVGLLLILTGSAQALVFSQQSNLGTLGVDPLSGGAYSPAGSFHTVTGGGSDIGGTADHGYFVYEELAGDGIIEVQVFGFGAGTSGDRKGGLMILDSVAPEDQADNAINVANFVLAKTDAGNQVIQAQTRLETGGDTSSVDTVGAPVGSIGVQPWIRLERDGNVFKAWYSKTKVTWDLLAEETVPMDGTVFVGLAVSAHNNDQTESVTFRNASYTFGAATTLTWNNSADNFWDTANWDTPPPTIPDRTTHVRVEGTIDNRVTVRSAVTDNEALTLTVLDDGEIAIEAGQLLTVFGSVEFGPDALLEMDDGASLSVFGGTIPVLAAWRGDATIDTTSDLDVARLDGNGAYAGTFTKLGPGRLQFDNSSGTAMFADSTTFDVQKGTLASKGSNPLGRANHVKLSADTLLELVNNPGLIDMEAALTVNGSAEAYLDTTGGASLGALTLNDDLKTSGSGGVSFDSTSVPVSAVTIYTDNDTTAGPITAPGNTITKDGPESLIVTAGGDVTGAIFVVEDGELVGVYGPDNPLGGADLVGAGGTIVLATAAGSPAVFDNALSLTENSDLIGGGVGSGETVVLGGTNGVTLNDKQLYVGTIDGYTLEIAGAIADTSGEIRMEEGTVNVTGGGGGSSTDLRTVGSGTLNVNGALLTLDDMRTYDGTLNIQSEVVVVDNLEVHGGLLATTAKLTADDVYIQGGTMTTEADLVITDYIEVSSGAATTNAAVNSPGDPAPYVEVTGGALDMKAVAYAEEVVVTGGLAGAAELVISDSLKQGVNTYSIDTGTFTARGSDLLNGVTLEFGGNTLTVTPPAPIPISTAGLVGLWTFDDETANDSSGHGYNGQLQGGAYSSDVPAALAGGKSIDLNGGDYYVVVDTDTPEGTDPDQNVFDLDTMTIACWVKEWPDGSWEPYVSKRGESGEAWQLRRAGGSGDQLAFTLRGAGDDYWGNGENIDDGQWHLIAGIYDGSTQTIWIDDHVNASRGQTGTVNDTASRLVFGARDNSGGDPASMESYSRVKMDDVYIYDRALSQDELMALYYNGPAALDLPSTNFKVTDNATLEAATLVDAAVFRNLELVSGVELTLVTDAPDGMSFDDLTAGDGDSIVGDLTVRGELSVGDSPGMLDVTGDLTLGEDATYLWDLDLTAGGSDVVNVRGEQSMLRLEDGWTLSVNTSELPVYGKHLLFTYEGLLRPATPEINVENAPQEWQWAVDNDKVWMEVDLEGNVLLQVPEPATWILLLSAGLIGLIGVARRRRKAA